MSAKPKRPRMNSEARASRRGIELKVLTRVAKALATPSPLPELLQAVMGEISLLLAPSEYGLLLLWDPSEGLFRPQAVCGDGIPNPESLTALALRRGEAITGKVFETGQSQALLSTEAVRAWMVDMQPRNREAFQRALGDGDRPSGVVATPLSAGENRYGVLLLGSARGAGRLRIWTEGHGRLIRQSRLCVDHDRAAPLGDPGAAQSRTRSATA